MGTTNKGALALRELVDPKPRITRAELAERLRLKSQGAVGEWLRGKNLPRPEAMRELEDAFGIPMRWWLEPAEDPDVDGTPAADASSTVLPSSDDEA